MRSTRGIVRGIVAALAGIVLAVSPLTAVAYADEPDAGDLWGYVTYGDGTGSAGAGEVLAEAKGPWPSTATTVVETEADGRFVFPDLPAGEYDLKFTAQSPQYKVTWWPGTSNSTWRTAVTVPFTSDPLALTMVPNGSVSGRVSLGSSGNWAGTGEVRVTVSKCELDDYPESDRCVPEYAYTGLTDADGAYSIDGLVAGYYLLSYDYLGSGGYSSVGDDLFDLHLHSSLGFHPTGQDAVLPVGATLSGIITLDGVPATADDVEVNLVGEYPWAEEFVIEPGDPGRYFFDGLDGRYTLSITYIGDGDFVSPAAQSIYFYPGETDTRDFDLVSGGRLSGRVTDSSGAGFSQGTVRVYRERDYGWYSVFEFEDLFNLESDGEWSISRLPAGNYEVRVSTTSCGGTTWCYTNTRWRDPTTGSYSFTLDEYGVRDGLDITMYRTGAILGEMVCGFCSDDYSPTSGLRWFDQFTGAWEAMPYRATGYSIPDYHVAPATYMVEGGGAFGVAPWGIGPLTLGEEETVDLGEIELERANFLVRTSNGSLYRYPAVNGRLGSAQKLSTVYGQYTKVVDAGDVDHDGFADLYVVNKSGVLFVRPGNADGKFGAATRVSSGWKGYKFVLGFPDLTGDGHPDLVAQGSSGALYLFPGDGDRGLGERRTIGSASQWKGYNYLAVDANHLIARGSSGKTYVFSPSVDGTAFDNRNLLTSKWSTATQILSVGGFDADGWRDVIVRTSGGSIVLWRGNPDGSVGNPVTLATKWSGRLLI